MHYAYAVYSIQFNCQLPMRQYNTRRRRSPRRLSPAFRCFTTPPQPSSLPPLARCANRAKQPQLFMFVSCCLALTHFPLLLLLPTAVWLLLQCGSLSRLEVELRFVACLSVTDACVRVRVCVCVGCECSSDYCVTWGQQFPLRFSFPFPLPPPPPAHTLNISNWVNDHKGSVVSTAL